MIYSIYILLFLAIVLILFVKTKTKGIITVSAVIAISIISSIVSVQALSGDVFQQIIKGSFVFGDVLIRIDSLSAWFILLINFTFITGSLYGLQYMKKYQEQKNSITLHCIALIIAHSSLIGICIVQNAMVFLIFWELMALSAFIIVIFESGKQAVLSAGINYLIQSHISIVFLMLGFMFVAFKTGSYSFSAIAEFSANQSTIASTVLFFCFFIAFAIKAGFVPFHTWLPYAHPAAPAHVSGIMSGVIIKIGIFGILRMLLLIKCDYTAVGYIILIISVISGVYGVALAIIQHDLKRLLAYHSIENIGIIGIGIGLGCIGIGSANNFIAIAGFSGAMLHVLNHSLFKSLLFYSAGNVYQSTHSLNIEKLGGLIKFLPHTAFLFLIAALAICGLPPLNGFISEFIIYGGLYNWLVTADSIAIVVTVFSVAGLVLIGGLAILCFTKAFGIVFLGNIRQSESIQIKERKFWQLFPMYMVAFMIIVIGLFSSVFIKLVQIPASLFTKLDSLTPVIISAEALNSIKLVNIFSAVFIALVLLIFALRRYVNRNRQIETNTTWGCGYPGANLKLQYTASSFVKSFVRLAKPFLSISKSSVKPVAIFPDESFHKTHPYDKLEANIIDRPIKWMKIFLGRFVFLQRGRLQQSILYGIIFISSIILIPLIVEKIAQFIYFLNHL